MMFAFWNNHLSLSLDRNKIDLLWEWQVFDLYIATGIIFIDSKLDKASFRG